MIMPQYQTLQVLLPQVIHLVSHQRSLPQLQILHQVTIPVYIPPFSLSYTQTQCYINPSTSLKWPFPSSLSSLLLHLQPYCYNWFNWRCSSKRLILPIPLKCLIIMSKFWNIIRSQSITSWSSSRTTPYPQFIWHIYHPIPPSFQHPSHLIFHHMGLP